MNYPLIDINNERFAIDFLNSVTINGDTVELTFHRDGKARVRNVRKAVWDLFFQKHDEELKINSPDFQIFGD
jgi:hypothetical protein